MTQDIQALAAQVVEAIRDAPELAQRLVEAPAATVEKICVGNPGVDLTSLFMAVLDKLEGLDVDLSGLDLSRLDLDALDLSRLDPARLLSIATKLGVDVLEGRHGRHREQDARGRWPRRPSGRPLRR